MDTLECIATRRSIRKFKSKPIQEEILNEILKSATFAPSSGNLQNWEFIIIKNQKSKEEISRIALGQDFIRTADTLIVVCSNQEKILSYGKRGLDLYSIQNTAAATQNLLLAAWSFGIGSCWVGAFNESKLKEFLNIPEHVKPVAIIPLGYPDEKPNMRQRLELNRIVFKEKYGRRV